MSPPAFSKEGKSMKVFFDKSVVIRGLKKAASLIPAKGSESLKQLWLTAKDGRICFDASDGNIFFTGEYPAVVEEEGTIGINGKIFCGIIDSCNDPIQIAADDKNAKIKHKGGRCKLPVYGTTVEDKPVSPEHANQIEVNGETLKEYIEKVLFCTDSSYCGMDALSCVNFDEDDGRLTLYGIDGRRMAVLSVPAIEIPEQVLIQRAYLNYLSKWLDNQLIVVSITEKFIFFDNSSGDKVVVPRAHGEFPDSKALLSRVKNGNDLSVMTIRQEDLLAALKRVCVVDTDVDSTIAFSFNDGKLHCEAIAESSGSVSEDIPIEYSGNVEKIAFRTKSIIEILEHLTSEEIRFSMTSETGPCLITGDNENYKVLIMPVYSNVEKGE